MNDLSTLIKNITESCAENNKKKTALKSGSISAKVTVNHLLALSKAIKTAIELDTSLYSITVSYGAGFFPKVPWIGITNKGKRVSNSVSVTVCFSAYGDGLVCGAMLFKRKKKGIFQTIDRVGDCITLEGGSTKSEYTNRYFNPKDFYTNNLRTNELIKHLRDSLELMNKIHNSKELLTI